MLLQFLRALLLSCLTKLGGNLRINEDIPNVPLPDAPPSLEENRAPSMRGIPPEKLASVRHSKERETLEAEVDIAIFEQNRKVKIESAVLFEQESKKERFEIKSQATI